MTTYYRWETTLGERRGADPSIDNPAFHAEAHDIRNACDIGYHLVQVDKRRGMIQSGVIRPPPPSSITPTHSCGQLKPTARS